MPSLHSGHHVAQDLVCHAIEKLHMGRCGDCSVVDSTVWITQTWSLLGCVPMCSNAEQVLQLDAYHLPKDAEIAGCFEDSMEAAA